MANTIFTWRNFCFGFCTLFVLNVTLGGPSHLWKRRYMYAVNAAVKAGQPLPHPPVQSTVEKYSTMIVGYLNWWALFMGCFTVGDLYYKDDPELATATDNGDPELASASDNVDPEPVTATDQEDGESGAPSMAYTLPILLGLVSTLFLM
eukprot:152403_1